MRTATAIWLLVTVAACVEAANNSTSAGGGGEPQFLTEPNDVHKRVGQSVVMPCRVKNRNQGRVQWTRDGFGLGSSRTTDFPRYSVIGNDLDSDWDLHIEQIEVDDDAEFECQVVVDARRSLRSRKAKLTVYVPPEAPFIQQGSEIQVKEGMATQLTCVSRGGKPPAKIDWFDHTNTVIEDFDYHFQKMNLPNDRLFESRSTVHFIPSRTHHESKFKCEAWNEADKLVEPGDRVSYRNPAYVRLFVNYPPTVTVQAIRTGPIQEGSKAAYRCLSEANPAPSIDSYEWYIDNEKQNNQRRSYFEIYNVTRNYHDKQVKCSVYNDLGRAEGLKTIQVKYGPSIVQQPRTASGDNLASATLNCAVDGNPPPKYRWTKGQSREIISQDQNLTLIVTDESVGTYFCHAEVEGYAPVTSNPAEILMTGRPEITSSQDQMGVVGDNVHIKCTAVAIPQAQRVVWKYHGHTIQEDNNHYRVIQSPVAHGIRSTLVIKQALETDFGPYTCIVENSHGRAELEINLEQQRPIQLQMILIAVFGAVILVLLTIILLILFRKKCCDGGGTFGGKAAKSTNGTGDGGVKGERLSAQDNRNNVVKVNNLVEQLGGISQHMNHHHIDGGGSEWGSSSCGGGGGGLRGDHDSLASGGGQHHATTLPRMMGIAGGAGGPMSTAGSSELLDEPEFPPKPDVIDTGYVPYSNNLRDYAPPNALGGGGVGGGTLGRGDIVSRLNVTDPRFSATYGNPYLRSQRPQSQALLLNNSSYSSSSPPPPPLQGGQVVMGPANPAVSSFLPNGGGTMQRLVVQTTVPSTTATSQQYPSQPQSQIVPMSSSTPNSSVSNMACLPSGSEGIDPELVALGEDHTGAPVAGPPRGGARGIMTNNNNGSASCSTVSTSSCTPSPPSMLPVHLCPPSQQQQQHRVVPNLRTTMTSPQPTAHQQPPSGALYGVSNGPAHQMASRGDQVVMTSPTKFPPPMPINNLPLHGGSMTSFGPPSHQQLQQQQPRRVLVDGGSGTNNNNGAGPISPRYSTLGNTGYSAAANATYSTVNKKPPEAKKASSSSMGTHV